MSIATKTTILGAAALGLLLAASPAESQDRWGVELRGGGGVAAQDIGTPEVSYANFGFEGTVRYRFQPHLAVYAGWDWISFRPDDGLEGIEDDFEETGYAFGLRFEHPFSGETGEGPAYWLRAGGTYDHVEVEGEEGEIVADSGHGLGWEAGAGVSLGLGDTWRLTPGVRYRSLSRDVTVGALEIPLDLDYFLFEVGFARTF